MKTIRITALFVLALSLFTVTIEAQRTRRPTPKATPKPTPVRTTPTNAVVSSAKQTVSNQLHNVNVFVDKMGPIAVTLEALDRDAAARRLTGQKLAEHEKNKKDVVSAFAAMRATLVSLESDFRSGSLAATNFPAIALSSAAAASPLMPWIFVKYCDS